MSATEWIRRDPVVSLQVSETRGKHFDYARGKAMVTCKGLVREWSQAFANIPIHLQTSPSKSTSAAIRTAASARLWCCLEKFQRDIRRECRDRFVPVRDPHSVSTRCVLIAKPVTFLLIDRWFPSP